LTPPDGMMGDGAARRGPRILGDALRDVRAAAAPETLLAAVQAAWPNVAGERVAAEARPVAERDGTVTVACRSAIWAQELDLLQAALIERLNAISDVVGRGPVSRLRFTADAVRHADPGSHHV
jgi:predicted nucleic acid-binding Zn ribbon protein